MALVEIEKLTKKYGDVSVLSDITNSVEHGEVVGIIGPNGGGKSTLLNTLAGLVLPTDGTVTIDGTPAHELARKSAGKIGLVTAEAGVYPLLTGTENLHYFAGLFGLETAEIDARAEELIAEFELGPAMNTRTKTWSTGMKQRLSLIRALVPRPDLLLFDEPTANLDPIGERLLHERLRAYADDGHAGVLVTHRLEHAQSVCDRVWLLDEQILQVIELQRGEFEVPGGPLFDAWEAHQTGVA